MTRREETARRGAYTLIELLVVIAILAVLVSLTAAGIFRYLGKGPEVQTQSDIQQLASAIEQFKTEFKVDRVPSFLILRERYDAATYANPPLPREKESIQFIARMFPRINPLAPHDWTGQRGGPQNVPPSNTATAPIVLQGHECLVFFLGGIPTQDRKGVQGFSSSPSSPTALGGSRRGPFFDFKSHRLAVGPSGQMLMYHDAFINDTPMPYAYFSAGRIADGYVANDCSSLGVAPYVRVIEGTAPNQVVRFYNPNSFQIISAGPDGQFGSGGTYGVGAGRKGVPDDDNYGNFHENKRLSVEP